MRSTGHLWRPTRQPVVLSEWHASPPPREVFTTVMNWSASKHPPVYAGVTYGQKDVEFDRFIELPERSGAAFEIVVNAGKWRRAPVDLIRAKGWRVLDAEQACVDLDSYRDYIRSSMAEWSVAKNGYVRGRPGWFSERSACYLAAGRPAVVQDTGLGGVLPVGVGVVTFTSLEEAVEAVREVRGDYARHARSAREIAAAYFDSDTVLARLVEEAMDGGGRLGIARGRSEVATASRGGREGDGD
jgi:phosphoribosylamine-glycine ligase